MKRPTQRRTVLMAAGAAAIAVVTGSAAAQPANIDGAIVFAGGKVIPEGRIEIYLEDRVTQDRALRRVAATQVTSDGASRTINFTVTGPAHDADVTSLQIVARLERADGWLLARGSALFKPGHSIDVMLSSVVY
jgi:hypothetical protein